MTVLSPAKLDRYTRLVPLTVDQYHRMIETGILPEGSPIELVGGYLVQKDRSKAGEDPMTVGHGHAWVVGQLTDLAPEVKQAGCHIRIQQPMTIPDYDEPEPDAVIVAGPREALRGRHPGPGEVTCVVEVSDSSLQHDRVTKQRMYAEAGIPQYVIANLVDDVMEDYREPLATGLYGRPRTLHRGEVLRLETGGGRCLEVAVEWLLP